MAPSEWVRTPTKCKFNEWRYTTESNEIIELKLTQGKTCLFNTIFKDMLLKHKWCAVKDRKGWYAYTGLNKTTFKMHRLILNVVDPTVVVDHKDRNGLNNIFSNITVSTPLLNGNNRNMRSSNTSNENGISLNGRGNRGEGWRVLWVEGTKRKTKCFGFGSRSLMNKTEALAAAKIFRDIVYARIGNRNGIRS